MKSALLGVCLAVAVTGGCGTGGVDAQEDVDSPDSATPAPPSTSSEYDLPERPRSLRANGVDPCVLIPESERAGLEIDRPPNRTEVGEDEPVFMAPLCSFSVIEWGAYGVVASDTYAAQDWLDETPSQRKDTRIIDIGGFAAVVLNPSDAPDECYVTIDIGESSGLSVNSYDRREEPEFRAKVCDATIKAAGIALTTLEGMQ